MRVFLLAPDFRTLGGFELQLATLAGRLSQEGLQVEAFFREPVRTHHPYRLRMQAAGVRIHAPHAWLAAILNPSKEQRQRCLTLLMAPCLPLLFPVSVFDGTIRHRPWRRSWQGGRGRLRAWLAPLVSFDALTAWMHFCLDWISRWRRPDLIDVQHSMLPSGIRYGKQRHLPTVYTEYGAPAEELWPVWIGLVPVINEADIIIGRAEASLAGLRRLCAARQPMVVVPNAVTQLPDDGEPAYPPHPRGEVTITAIGRLAPEKGLFVLLEAFRLLLAGGVPARLRLAGDGPSREALVTQAATLGLSSQVEFLGTFDALAPIMLVTDIVVHPTLNDGRSVAVLEAMAWGRPVVASRVGGLAELIEDDVSGLLVPAADPVALASALERLVVDPACRERLGRAARARFLAGGFNADNMVSATIDAYHFALNKSVAAQVD